MAQYFCEYCDLTSDYETSILLTSFISVCGFCTYTYGVCVIIIFQLLLLSAWHIFVVTIQKADLEMMKALCHARLL